MACFKLLHAKSVPLEVLCSAIFCLLDEPAEMAPEGITMKVSSVLNGADGVCRCLDADLVACDQTGHCNEVFRSRAARAARASTAD